MPSGVYQRKPEKCPTFFKKGNIPHNKGIESSNKLKKMQKFRLNLPIECKKHGEHINWRMHSFNNVQCKFCAYENQRKRKTQNPLRACLIDAKQHSKKNNRTFEINEQDLINLRIIQENKCALTGVTFDEKFIPSIDRIDSSKGYEKENIQLVIIEINRMKSNLSPDRFIQLCEYVAGKAKKKKKK